MESPTPRQGLPWRRWNTALHRDIGYLSVGLTLLFAISGVALNHVADWNPSYRVVKETHELGSLDRQLDEGAQAAEVLRRLNIPEKPKSAIQPEENTLQIFLKDRSLKVDLATGRTLMDAKVPRAFLYPVNRLHINAPKGLWTWIADVYAVMLAFLAISGLFILRGRQGLAGRGAWLTLAGLLLPLLFWLGYTLR